MHIAIEDVIRRMVADYGYPEWQAPETARRLCQCSAPVQEAFERWWEDGWLDPALEVQGYTLHRLIDDYEFKPFAAFLMMDWLLRDPQTALPLLTKGYDSIQGLP